MSLKVNIDFRANLRDFSRGVSAVDRELGSMVADAQRVTRAFGRLDTETDQLDYSMRALARSLSRADTNTEELTRDARRAERGLDELGDEARRTERDIDRLGDHLRRLKMPNLKGKFEIGGLSDILSSVMHGDISGALSGTLRALAPLSSLLGAAGLGGLAGAMKNTGKEAEKSNRSIKKMWVSLFKVLTGWRLIELAAVGVSKVLDRMAKGINKVKIKVDIPDDDIWRKELNDLMGRTIKVKVKYDDVDGLREILHETDIEIKHILTRIESFSGKKILDTTRMRADAGELDDVLRKVAKSFIYLDEAQSIMARSANKADLKGQALSVKRLSTRLDEAVTGFHKLGVELDDLALAKMAADLDDMDDEFRHLIRSLGHTSDESDRLGDSFRHLGDDTGSVDFYSMGIDLRTLGNYLGDHNDSIGRLRTSYRNYGDELDKHEGKYGKLGGAIRGFTSLAGTIAPAVAGGVAGIAALAGIAAVAAAAIAGVTAAVVGVLSAKYYISYTDQVLGLANAFGEWDAELGRASDESIRLADQISRLAQRAGLDLNDVSEILAEFSNKQGIVQENFAGFEWNNDDMMSNLIGVIDQLSEIPNGTERSKLAFQLFGEEGAKQLLPILSNAQAIDDILSDKQWVTPEDIEQMQEWNQNWTDIKTRIQEVALAIGGPLVAAANDFFTGFKEGSDESSSKAQQLGNWLRGIWEWLKQMWDKLKPVRDYFKKIWDELVEISEDPDVRWFMDKIVKMLLTIGGAIVIGGLMALAGIVRGIAGAFEAVAHAAKKAYDWIMKIPGAKTVAGWVGMGPNKAAASFSLRPPPAAYYYTPPPTPAPAATAPSGGSGTTINVTVNGALDAVGVSRQIEELLRQHDGRIKGKPTWLGSPRA
jgi:hypothetical protein